MRIVGVSASVRQIDWCESGAAAAVGFRPLPMIQAATGLWRSLVAHLTGGQVVAGSNPVSPTKGHAGQSAFAAIASRRWPVCSATGSATAVLKRRPKSGPLADRHV